MFFISGEIPEDVDVFKLAGPSDEDSESGPAEDSDSDDEWVMADSAKQKASEGSEDSEDDLMLGTSDSELDMSSDEERLPEEAAKKPPKKGREMKDTTAKGSKSVFASAEDFAHLIAADKPVKMAKVKRTKRA